MLNTAAYVLKQNAAGSLKDGNGKKEDPGGALLELLQCLGLP